MSVFLFVTPCFSWERPLVQRRYRRARARGRAHWAVEVEAADGEWFLWSRGWEPWMVDTKSLQKRNQRMIYIYIYVSIYKNHGFRFDYVCVYWNLMWLVDSCWCASWSLISYEVLGQESSQDSAFKMQRLLESWGQDYCSNLDGSVWRWSVVSW